MASRRNQYERQSSGYRAIGIDSIGKESAIK